MVFLNRTSRKFPVRGGSSVGRAWKFRMRHARHRPRIGSTAACPPAGRMPASLPHPGPPSSSRPPAAQSPGTERLSPGGHRDRAQARTHSGREAEDPEPDAGGQGYGREARLAGQGRGRTEQGDCGTELVASAVTTGVQGGMGRSRNGGSDTAIQVAGFPSVQCPERSGWGKHLPLRTRRIGRGPGSERRDQHPGGWGSWRRSLIEGRWAVR